MEAISGRIHGFYLACYTTQMPEGHYGYAKVCPVPPSSPWQPNIAVHKYGTGPWPDEASALFSVTMDALRKLRHRRALARSRAIATTQPAPLSFDIDPTVVEPADTVPG